LKRNKSPSGDLSIGKNWDFESEQ